ncbi:MAG: hypothetical protein P1V51_13160 [Deltaproteobacteria bacterium]|nr:hypothetical protein [Deltaproteobacteria bacterium]
MRRAILLTLALLAAACTEPEVAPGAGVDLGLKGLIQGSVVYQGPRPTCAGDSPSVAGRVVLFLFSADDPPFPEGSATAPLNLLTLPGDHLFGAPAPCRGAGDDEVLLRSASFAWPGIAPGRYQIRAFYDDDGDFHPFFGLRAAPDAGDVVGAALEAGGARLAALVVPESEAIEERMLEGVVVTLGAVMRTSPPRSTLGRSPPSLSSRATFPLQPDPLLFEGALHDLSPQRLTRLSTADAATADAFAAAGIEDEDDALADAFYLRPLDLDGDGLPEPHPILGGQGVPWVTPLTILERVRSAEEVALGIPAVRLVASPRPSVIATRRARHPGLDLLLPPVALVELKPGDRACTIPYLAPGNLASAYEGAPAECQALPTGRYGYSVVHGLAGGEVVEGVPSASSDTGLDLVGASFATQSWRVPNALGPADTHYDPTAAAGLPDALQLPEQGPGARVAVVEPDPGLGLREGCESALDPTTGTMRAPVLEAVPATCCEAVAHLCELPLCAAQDFGPGRHLREIAGESAGVTCLPFELPASCCN